MLAPERHSQQLSLALKGAKCGLWDWNLADNTIYFDSNYFLISGYEPDDFPHHPDEWRKRVHPDDLALTERSVQQYLAGEIKALSIEFRFKTKNGDWMWILGQGEISERDQDGNPVRFVGLHIDITERKTNDDIIQQLNADLSATLMAIPDILFELDKKGTYLNIWTNNSHQLVDEKEILLGKSVVEILPSDVAATIMLSISETDMKGVDSGKIIYINTPNGPSWFELSTAKKTATNGDTTFIMLSRDITDRKQAEKALQDSEANLNSILRSAPIGIGQVTNRKINFANDNFAQMLGYSVPELLGKKSRMVYPSDEEFERVGQYKYEEIKKKGTGSIETVLQKKDGTLINVFLSSTPVNQDDLSQGVTFSALDITERKQAEEQQLKLEDQLRQKHKMEAVGYMAGGMAHNFNNNLAIILGGIDLTLIKLPGNSEVIPLLDNARISILRSRDLIQNILSYSRQGILQKAPMQLTAITDETHSLLRMTLPTTIRLQIVISPECDSTFINADASQIQEVLINLCNNAIQAMDEKGELKIQLEPVEITQQDISAQYDCLPGRYAKLSVQDSGCGMSAEILEKIFDPFYSTKGAHEGVGMGLATVQGIVAQHGGCIKVNSIPGQGTLFNIYFPIIEQTHIDESIAEDPTCPEGTERILFVDDDEILANLGQELLSEMGYQVTTMTDSTEALKMFVANADHFDLLVTDQTMPELTGQELIQELRKIRPNLAVILCTGYSSKVDADIAEDLEINAFLMKPLGLAKLAQTVRRVLDGVEIE